MTQEDCYKSVIRNWIAHKYACDVFAHNCTVMSYLLNDVYSTHYEITKSPTKDYYTVVNVSLLQLLIIYFITVSK